MKNREQVHFAFFLVFIQKEKRELLLSFLSNRPAIILLIHFGGKAGGRKCTGLFVISFLWYKKPN